MYIWIEEIFIDKIWFRDLRNYGVQLVIIDQKVLVVFIYCGYSI